jgi:hypothetical protein
MIRLRQVALVAADLDAATAELTGTLGVEVGFRDPGVAEFGLHNVVVPVGDGFLEIVSPTQEGTTAGRLLERRGGDGGYMVILQCDDRLRRRARLEGLDVRVVWDLDLGDIAGTHLHPRDVGGAIVSIDEAHPWTSWRWAGLDWEQHVRTDTVDGLAGVVVGAHDPRAMAARWAEVLDVAADGTTINLDGGTRVVFQPAGPRGEGIDAVEVRAVDRSRVGDVHHAVGVALEFV